MIACKWSNRELRAKGREDDLLLAWQTSRELWGQNRTVVVTYNTRTATRQRYAFEQKLLRLQDELHLMRGKVNRQAAQWRSRNAVLERYLNLCRELHLPDDLYQVELHQEGKGLRMYCRKKYYRIGRHIDYFGKNILVTDHPDWTIDEIVQAGLDRYVVEQSFRQSKDHDLVAMLPLRHWTEGKIRCHVFTCVVALAYLRLLEIKLEEGRAHDLRRRGDGKHAYPAFLPVLAHQQPESPTALGGNNRKTGGNSAGFGL